MSYFNFTNIVSVIFLIYLSFVVHNFYELYYPTECNQNDANSKCLNPIDNWKSLYTISVCTTQNNAMPKSTLQCSKLINLLNENDFTSSFTRDIELEIPKSTKNNGSFTIYVIVHTSSKNSDNMVIKSVKLSKYQIRNTQKSFNLLNSNTNNEDENEMKNKDKPIVHLLKRLCISIMNNDIKFDTRFIPQEVHPDIKVTKRFEYLPILYINQLAMRDEFFQPINISDDNLNITIEYSPIAIGSIRLLKQLELSIESMKKLGFSDSQLGEITSIFTDNNIHLVLLTFGVSLFHLFFEFLAFKNDITFWRNKKNNIGVSIKSLTWRCFSQFVILMYLIQEETSLLILVPSGISILIELWKLSKAFKLRIDFSSGFPKITMGDTSKEEKECEEYDTTSMKYLSYVLYPLCIGAAIYTLIYGTHKSWFSWFINSLANSVYAFGFLFMTPQLFMNYKMKSVAHLPWRVFMYKAFNTFIDDVFAFIIKMPTAHRLACLRDDVVFVIYLYQRWLYPIDSSRVNEYGQSFNDDNKSNKKKD